MRYAWAVVAFCTAAGLVGGCDRNGSEPATGPAGAANRKTPLTAHEREVAACMAAMEAPGRKRWQKPDEVVAALKLEPGERVADVGSGPGYFTLRLAKAVGPTGKVWAVDIEQVLLDRLGEHAADAKLDNIECVLTVPHKPSLPPGRIDTALLVNTYYYLSNPRDYMIRLGEALAPGGRIVIIDLIPRSRAERGFGPPLHKQVSRERVDAVMSAVGFKPTAVHTFLPEQYFVEYRRETAP